MPDIEFVEISDRQLERADQILKSVPALIELGDYYSAVNRIVLCRFSRDKSA